ncbi:hypothetical protein Tco_1445100 [Tanacetum coccineum]
MLTTRQGISSTRFEHIVNQRANAIEVIDVYVAKICMDRDSMDQVIHNRNGYAEKLPLCNKCKLHHTGPCTVKYNNCKRVGQMTRDCRTPIIATTQGARVAIKKLQLLAMSVESKGITRISARS